MTLLETSARITDHTLFAPGHVLLHTNTTKSLVLNVTPSSSGLHVPRIDLVTEDGEVLIAERLDQIRVLANLSTLQIFYP